MTARPARAQAWTARGTPRAPGRLESIPTRPRTGAPLLEPVFTVWHITQAVVAAGWLGWWCVGVDEWRTRKAAEAAAKVRDKRSRAEHARAKAADKLPRHVALLIGAAGLVASIAVALLVPSATYAASGALAVVGWRHRNPPPVGELGELRSALLAVMNGPGPKGERPDVITRGEHTAGGPAELTITPIPGWAHWQESRQNALEAAIEGTLLGDWSLTRWSTKGRSTWTRLPEIPARVIYDGPVRGLGWNELPLGADGTRDQWRTVDLALEAHVFVGGATGGGKTSLLRCWTQHLAHHLIPRQVDPDHPLIWIGDISGTSHAYLEDRSGFRLANTGYVDVEQLCLDLETEVRDRRELHRATGQYRPPLVAIIDELEVLFTDARRIRGTKNPEIIDALNNVGRYGRGVDVHLILATQRPEEKTIPLSIRDNCKHRVAVGRMGMQAARMVLEDEWARAAGLPAGRKGICAAIAGDWTGEAQTPWLADPHDSRHPDHERDFADRLFPRPSRLHVHNDRAAAQAPADEPWPDAMHWTPPAPGTTHGTTHTTGHTSTTDTPDKWPAFAPASAHVSRPGPVSGGGSGPRSAEEVLEARRRSDRERKARQVARDRDDSRDPGWEHHGTERGLRAGCPCPRCRGWAELRKVQVT
jgi:hypothetical protein